LRGELTWDGESRDRRRCPKKKKKVERGVDAEKKGKNQSRCTFKKNEREGLWGKGGKRYEMNWSMGEQWQETIQAQKED